MVAEAIQNYNKVVEKVRNCSFNLFVNSQMHPLPTCHFPPTLSDALCEWTL